MLDKPDRRAGAKGKERSASTVVAPPCAMVIFGAAGDLTKRLVVPALYNLSCQELLPPGLAVIGVAMTDMTDGSFRSQMEQSAKRSAGTKSELPQSRSGSGK